MTPDDVLATQTRWRTLTIRRAGRIVQFFADYSPESWWDSRYLPSQSALETGGQVQTTFLSKDGFSTQVNLSLADARAKTAIFHRRTITSKVWREIIAIPNVSPVFVVPEPREISLNPTMPLAEWVGMVSDARAGLCRLAVETESGVESLARLGVHALYLPPVWTLPVNLRVEGRTRSNSFRVLLASESYPHHDLLGALLALDGWEKSSEYPHQKPLRIVLSLGEGPFSSQETYRDGLVAAAEEMFGNRVETWHRTRRIPFLKQMALNVDAVLDPMPCSKVAFEANALGIPVYRVESEFPTHYAVTDDSGARQKSRRQFWSLV